MSRPSYDWMSKSHRRPGNQDLGHRILQNKPPRLRISRKEYLRTADSFPTDLLVGRPVRLLTCVVAVLNLPASLTRLQTRLLRPAISARGFLVACTGARGRDGVAHFSETVTAWHI